jgi:hypothetical protein
MEDRIIWRRGDPEQCYNLSWLQKIPFNAREWWSKVKKLL